MGFPSAVASPGGAPRRLGAIRHRNYAWFIGGSAVSYIGDWMDQAALNWLVLQWTGSPFALGLLNFFRLLPMLFLTLVGGVIADRVERRRLLMVTAWSGLIASVGIAVLVGTGVRNLPLLYALVFARGAISAFERPGRQALIPSLVPREDLLSAVALHSSAHNLARITGPALGGILVGVIGLAPTLYVNAASFLAVIAALHLIRGLPPTAVGAGGSLLGGLGEAWRYITGNRVVTALLLLALVPFLLAHPYTSMMPVFARDILRVGPEGFGLLLSAPAVGGIAASLWQAAFGTARRRGPLLLLGPFLFGALLAAFSASRSYGTSLALLLVVGVVQQGYLVLNNTAIHTLVPDGLRGRVMSIYFLDRGLIPLGSLAMGALGSWIGVPWALGLMGIGCSLATLAVGAACREIARLD